MNLTDLQNEILKEAFNVGVGRAAGSLEELVQGSHEVRLSVPSVEFVSLGDLAARLDNAGQDLSGVLEPFSGPFAGTAILLYTQREGLELVKAFLGDEIPADQLSELEGEALCEIGNIILNACLGAMGEFLEQEFFTEVPFLRTGTCLQLLTNGGVTPVSREVLYLRMSFALRDLDLHGHMGFTLDLASASTLAKCLDAYATNVLGV